MDVRWWLCSSVKSALLRFERIVLCFALWALECPHGAVSRSVEAAWRNVCWNVSCGFGVNFYGAIDGESLVMVGCLEGQVQRRFPSDGGGGGNKMARNGEGARWRPNSNRVG